MNRAATKINARSDLKVSRTKIVQKKNPPT